MNFSSVKIQRRDDLIPPAVAYKFRLSGTSYGAPYTAVLNDIAIAGLEGIGMPGALTGLDGVTNLTAPQIAALEQAALRPGVPIATFDFEGGSINASKATIATYTIPDNGSAPLASPGYGSNSDFWDTLFPELADLTNVNLFVPGGATSSFTCEDSNRNPIDLTKYKYLLTDGQVAPWMKAFAVQVKITAVFTWSSQAATYGATGSRENDHTPFDNTTEAKSVQKTLLSIPGGTYYSSPTVQPGEPVPYGLAGYYLAIESIPQYQGSFAVQEQDVTDVCPLGNNLNLTGGLAEWATMNACVQSVVYDHTGRTTITFGPARHLGAADFVERLRVNRGPRNYFLIGSDLTNSSQDSDGAGLGSNLPKHNTVSAAELKSAHVFPANVADLLAHGYPPGQVPGINLNALADGTLDYSGVQKQPFIVLANGAGGNVLGNQIRIALQDFLANAAATAGGGDIRLREIGVCYNGDNSYYAMALISLPYKKS